MSDFNKPTNTENYANIWGIVRAMFAALAKWDFTGISNVPTNAKRHDSTTKKIQQWNGSAWADLDVNFGNNVGIGINPPTAKLHVSGAGFDGGGAIFASTNSGNGISVTGVDGAGLNDSAYVALSDGTNNAYIGLSGTNATPVGDLRFGVFNTEWMRLKKSTGRLGIGAASPSLKLHVATTTEDDGILIDTTQNRPIINLSRSGTVHGRIFVDGSGAVGTVNSVVIRAGSTGGVYMAVGATSWTAVSDERKKKNITPLSYGLAEVCEMQPIRFDYLDDESESALRIGFSAQNVRPLVPEAVVGSEDTHYGLSATELIPVLVNAIKELEARVAALEAV